MPANPNPSLRSEVIANIERSFNRERGTLKKYIEKYDASLHVLSTATVPLFGSNFSENLPIDSEKNFHSRSAYSTDDNISPHSRFRAMTMNIRERRGKKVSITPKLLVDEHTDTSLFPKNKQGEPVIHMDSQLFGMGSNSLQLTFESSNLSHARYLHDMLLPLGPLFLALSANSALFRGMLAGVDTRWSVIAGSVDSRTEEEMDPEGPNYINKSRYSGMNHYISKHQYVRAEHTDTPQLKASKAHLQLLAEAGVDEVLASHIAQLFVHDAMVVFPDKLEVDDSKTTNHFENLQSTNWNSMRFKPPPSMDSNIGWRVEFRTMELQLTDMENAALTVAISMLVNVVNFYNVDFIVPISLVDQNFERAEQPNAASEQRFWFKVQRQPGKGHPSPSLKPNKLKSTNFMRSDIEEVDSEYRELTLEQILSGYEQEGWAFPGLFTLVKQYMRDMEFPEDERNKICRYLCYLTQRAKGLNLTGAQWMRNFVREHDAYKKDSFVSEEVLFDMYHSDAIQDPFRSFQSSASSCEEYCDHKSSKETAALLSSNEAFNMFLQFEDECAALPVSDDFYADCPILA